MLDSAGELKTAPKSDANVFEQAPQCVVGVFLGTMQIVRRVQWLARNKDAPAALP